MEIKRVKIDGYGQCLKIAAECIKQDGLISFPTETFYALGVRYNYENGLKRIIDLKNRSLSKAFSLIIGNRSDLSYLVSDMDPLAEKIVDALWPAPLTVIFKARPELPPYIKDARNTVAVRMPGRSFALDLAQLTGIPITATSANKTGMPDARSAEEVAKYFPDGVDLLIDGGISTVELPSTIIDIQEGKIIVIREGAVQSSDILSFEEQ